MNLTGRGAIEAQIEEGLHLVAAIRRVQPLVGPWLDVGSGGGFPGLVLAACGVGAGWMVEPREKRCDFLELAVRRISADWRVIRGRLGERGCVPPVEGLTPGTFGGVGARAVWSPAVWVGIGSGWVAPGGWVAVHLRPGDPDPGGSAAAVRVDSARWSVRLYGVAERGGGPGSGVSRETAGGRVRGGDRDG